MDQENKTPKLKHGKLTREQVLYIRSHQEKSLRQLAKELGCSKTAVDRVRKWRIWADIYPD